MNSDNTGVCVSDSSCGCGIRRQPTSRANSLSSPQSQPSRQRSTQDNRSTLTSESVSTAIIIPARLDSARLPRKLLLAKTGKPLIQHTWEAALQSTLADAVAIATDSDEIAEACEGFGAEVIKSGEGDAGRTGGGKATHPNGTSRVAEAAKKFPASGVIVNLQADEPEITGADLDALICRVKDGRFARFGYVVDDDPSTIASGIATLAAPLRTQHRNNPHCVKVAVSNGMALYFSRAMMAASLHHVGVYAFLRETLDTLAERVLGEKSPLAEAERLEQLQWLEGGFRIAVEIVDWTFGGVNTALDYDEFVWRWERKRERE